MRKALIGLFVTACAAPLIAAPAQPELGARAYKSNDPATGGKAVAPDFPSHCRDRSSRCWINIPTRLAMPKLKKVRCSILDTASATSP